MPILMYKGVNLSGSGMSASSSLDDASENSVATTKLTNELNITKAPLESPVFTGTPEVPTAEGGSNSNQIANTEFVKAQIDNLTKAINDATALRASLEAYGLTKVTNSSAVTDSTGLALAATEKNASIDGTLANSISKLNSDIINNIPHFLSYTKLIHIPSKTSVTEHISPYDVGFPINSVLMIADVHEGTPKSPNKGVSMSYVIFKDDTNVYETDSVVDIALYNDTDIDRQMKIEINFLYKTIYLSK